MKNIYDIRSEKNLFYILSKYNVERENRSIVPIQIAIFVNLYYEDMVEYYLKYLKRLDLQIDIYIISSNDAILQYIDRKHKQSNFILLSKENRGRDISALLVTSRERISRYDYICFVHDKKPKEEYSKGDIELWTTELWENMLASDAYIKNIINLFIQNSNLGLLVPMEPVGGYWSSREGAYWGKNYENTLLLKQHLGLKCNIDPAKSPITLGTVFWSKPAALQKLFDLEWAYEDFNEEPLPIDGTLSHAIERILGYVAQDAGYDVATVMTSESASVQISTLYNGLAKAFTLLEETQAIHTFKELFDRADKKKQITNFCNQNTKIYLYGAGKKGIECLRLLRSWSIEPDGFVVTKGEGRDLIEGVKVVEFEKLKDDNLTGIIITPIYNAQKEIISNLEANSFHNYITYLDY